MREVEREANLGVGCGAADRVDGPPVRQQQVMRGGDRITLARPPGRVLAPCMPDPRADPRLVVRDPVADAVSEPAGHRLRVFHERLGSRARRPAAGVFERLRGIPVEERRERFDPVREELVDEPVVEVEPGLVDAPSPVREHARPGDRETECVEPELAHQRHVVAKAVVEVARHVARIAVADLAGRRAEPVPDTLPASVLVSRTLDLVRRGRSAPDEVGRERARVDGHVVLSIRFDGAVT